MPCWCLSVLLRSRDVWYVEIDFSFRDLGDKHSALSHFVSVHFIHNLCFRHFAARAFGSKAAKHGRIEEERLARSLGRWRWLWRRWRWECLEWTDTFPSAATYHKASGKLKKTTQCDWHNIMLGRCASVFHPVNNTLNYFRLIKCLSISRNQFSLIG